MTASDVLNADKNNFWYKFVSQGLGDKCVLNVLGNNVKNVCTSSLSLAPGDHKKSSISRVCQYNLGKGISEHPLRTYKTSNWFLLRTNWSQHRVLMLLKCCYFDVT
jgi:hypothetical protein